jgi:hypothetical protein
MASVSADDNPLALDRETMRAIGYSPSTLITRRFGRPPSNSA